MAQRVGYFQNTDDCYSEGPFVMVQACGWRIETGKTGDKCPTLPDISIYGFLREKGLPEGKYDDEDMAEAIVNFLNAKTKDAKSNGGYNTLTFNGFMWIWEPYEQMVEMKRWEKKRAEMFYQQGPIG